MKYYCEDSQQVLQELNSQKSGLTEKEAAERLLQNGANELKAAKGKSLLRRFAEQVADPMIVILLAAAAISGVLAVLENDSFADVIIILAVVLINAVLGVYQESKNSGKRKPEGRGSCIDGRIRSGHEADRSAFFSRRGTGCAFGRP